MDFDLERGLRDMAHRPDVRSTSLPVDTLIRRAHRRRAARATTYGAVGAGTAAALAVGGVGIADYVRDRGPEPAVVAPTPTPSPTRTPTPPAATPTPSPTAELPPAFVPSWDACGVPLEDFWGAEGSPAIGVENPDGGDPYVYLDAEDSVRALVNVQDTTQTGPVTARVVDVFAASFSDVAGPVIAGVAVEVPTGGSGTGAADQEPLALGEVDAVLTACDAAPALSSLDEDFYWLVLEVELTSADGAVSTIYGYGNLQVGDPVIEQPVAAPLVTGDASDMAPMTNNLVSVMFPACGETYHGASDGPSYWTLSGATSLTDGYVTTAVTATSLPGGSMALDIPDGVALEPIVTVTRDGVVVAQTPDEPRTPFVIKDWVLGSTVTRASSIPAVACTALDAEHPAGSALPSGTYQVWGMQQLSTAPTGPGSGWGAHYGGPWELVIP